MVPDLGSSRGESTKSKVVFLPWEHAQCTVLQIGHTVTQELLDVRELSWKYMKC